MKSEPMPNNSHIGVYTLLIHAVQFYYLRLKFNGINIESLREMQDQDEVIDSASLRLCDMYNLYTMMNVAVDTRIQREGEAERQHCEVCVSEPVNLLYNCVSNIYARNLTGSWPFFAIEIFQLIYYGDVFVPATIQSC